MNTYTTIDAVKSPSVLDMQHNREDERILAVIESVSRQIDGFCRRSFYVANETLTPDSRRLRTASETLSGAVDATQTSIAVSGQDDARAGHTLLIGSEQIYVRRVSAVNTLQVERGVNGTTAAAHQSGDAIRIFEYPAPVREAATIQTARTWRGKDAALGADLREMLSPYRRITF